jgi:hypothetical protein
MEKDYYKTKCGKETELRALVKNKKRMPFLRYKEREGVIQDDVHYATTLVLEDGTEIVSYSGKIFANARVGKYLNVKVSFCKMPGGKTLLYA